MKKNDFLLMSNKFTLTCSILFFVSFSILGFSSTIIIGTGKQLLSSCNHGANYCRSDLLTLTGITALNKEQYIINGLSSTIVEQRSFSQLMDNSIPLIEATLYSVPTISSRLELLPTSKIAYETNNGISIVLLEDGKIFQLNFKSGIYKLLVDLQAEDLPLDVTQVFDIASESIQNFSDKILQYDLERRIVYGDIDVLRRGDRLDIVFSGFSLGFPFVGKVSLQVKIDSDGLFLPTKINEAKILVSSLEPQHPGVAPAKKGEWSFLLREVLGPRGVAINRFGTILTTLPRKDNNNQVSPVDFVISLPIDFEPNNFTDPAVIQSELNACFSPICKVPKVILKKNDGSFARIDSRNGGMASDTDGNFWMAPGSVGSVECDKSATSSIIFISSSLNSFNCILMQQELPIEENRFLDKIQPIIWDTKDWMTDISVDPGMKSLFITTKGSTSSSFFNLDFTTNSTIWSFPLTSDTVENEKFNSEFQITNDLKIAAVIHTEDKGEINAQWIKGGEAVTQANDKVIWGYFYASPNDVSWGSSNNPEAFVKIWYDHTGRIDVNFFHVSVPDIEVYSEYNPESAAENSFSSLTSMDNRYVRQVYDSNSLLPVGTDETFSDGTYAGIDKSFENTLCVANGLHIAGKINTLKKGEINAIWHQGGRSKTIRGDEVVWGMFTASPDDVAWGNPDNPELFVKIWFDKFGRLDVNFFHVSVPEIFVYSDYQGFSSKSLTLIENGGHDRYHRHEYQLAQTGSNCE